MYNTITCGGLSESYGHIRSFFKRILWPKDANVNYNNGFGMKPREIETSKCAVPHAHLRKKPLAKNCRALAKNSLKKTFRKALKSWISKRWQCTHVLLEIELAPRLVNGLIICFRVNLEKSWKNELLTPGYSSAAGGNIMIFVDMFMQTKIWFKDRHRCFFPFCT